MFDSRHLHYPIEQLSSEQFVTRSQAHREERTHPPPQREGLNGGRGVPTHRSRREPVTNDQLYYSLLNDMPNASPKVVSQIVDEVARANGQRSAMLRLVDRYFDTCRAARQEPQAHQLLASLRA